MDLIQLEQQRKVLLDRKEEAISACRVEEEKLARIRADIQAQDRVLEERTGKLSSLDSLIIDRQEVLRGVEQQIIDRVKHIDALTAKQQEKEAMHIQKLKEVELNRSGLNQDVVNLQRAIDLLRKEQGEAQQKLEDTARQLEFMLFSLNTETTKYNDLAIGRIQETQRLKKERETLELFSKNLQKEKNELYTLRSDLSVLKERYEKFARAHNLPFNA